MAVPPSWAIHTCSTRPSPVSRSPWTSTAHAEQEYARVGPTPAPLNLAARLGGGRGPAVVREDPEDVGNHEGEEGVRPLADVGRAAEDGHPAAPVDLDHDAGVRHVVPVDGQARPREIRGRREADPPPGWELPGLLPPSRRRHHPVDALAEAGGRDREVVDRLAVGRDGVAM